MQYTFRCILDITDNVIRDIAINPSDNLLDLHKAIVQAFGFSSGEMAAFYRTNADWEQGEEIPLVKMDTIGNSPEMKELSLSDAFTQTEDKLLYIYDFLNLWTFFIELHKVENNESIKTPKLVFSVGELPLQAPEKHFTSEKIGDDFEDEFGDELDDEFNENMDSYY